MKTITRFMYLIFLTTVVVSCTSDDDTGGGEETPQYNLDDLQGKWYRAYSNNPDSDGMEVTVTGDQGKVTNAAGSGFSLNSVKWKDIIATDIKKYQHSELGSDGNYYEGFMELGQDDTLRISVGHSGAGNMQKWVRTYTEPEPEPELNECTPYEPDNFTNSISGTWSEPNEEDVYPGLLPASTDPAGGYYIVTLQAEESVPWIDIRIAGDAAAIINGSNGTTDNTTRKVAFAAHPGISYDVMVKPFFNGSSFPETYTITWEYVGIMDCYEYNNDFDQAKFIPKNETIEAFANINNEGYGIQEEHQDFYKVVLHQPAKLQVELQQSPSDNFITFRMFRDSSPGGSIVTYLTPISGNPAGAEAGSLYYKTSNNTLEPGVYYIEFKAYMVFGHKTADFDDGEALPDTWLTPYKFKVTALQ